MELPAWRMRFDDAPLEQVDLGQPAVAAEDIGVAPISRIHGGSVGEVAETLDAAEDGAGAGVDHRHAAAGALDDDAEIARAAQGGRGAGREQKCGNEGKQGFHQRISSGKPASAGARSSRLRLRSGRRSRAASACPAGRGAQYSGAIPPAFRAASPAAAPGLGRPSGSGHGRRRNPAAPCAPARGHARARGRRQPWPAAPAGTGRRVGSLPGIGSRTGEACPVEARKALIFVNGRKRSSLAANARFIGVKRSGRKKTGARRPPFASARADSRSIHVFLGVVDVELAGRRDQRLVLDHRLQLARLVIDHDDRRLVVLGAPYREPDLVAGLVVFRLDDALGALAHAGPLARSAGRQSPCRGC